MTEIEHALVEQVEELTDGRIARNARIKELEEALEAERRRVDQMQHDITHLTEQLDPTSNHYDRWWSKPERITEKWLADTREKMQEAQTDPFCHDSADIMLALLNLIGDLEKSLRAARQYPRIDDRTNALLDALGAERRRNRTRPDYNLRCQECGAPHWLDTSLPSEVWNQIAKPEDVLCLLCINDKLATVGLKAEAEFYFAGRSLTSKLYGDDRTEKAEAKRAEA